MFCLGCGYDLHALSEHRCPECGRVFDPRDESTYSPTRWLRVSSPRALLGLAMVIGGMASAAPLLWLTGFAACVVAPLIIIAGVAVMYYRPKDDSQ